MYKNTVIQQQGHMAQDDVYVDFAALSEALISVLNPLQTVCDKLTGELTASRGVTVEVFSIFPKAIDLVEARIPIPYLSPECLRSARESHKCTPADWMFAITAGNNDEAFSERLIGLLSTQLGIDYNVELELQGGVYGVEPELTIPAVKLQEGAPLLGARLEALAVLSPSRLARRVQEFAFYSASSLKGGPML